MKSICPALAAVAFSVSPAGAAVINSYAAVGHLDAADEPVYVWNVDDAFDTANERRSVAMRGDFADGAFKLSGAGTADASTGVLTSSASVGGPGERYGSAEGSGQLFSTFVADRTGSVDINFDLDAKWTSNVAPGSKSAQVYLESAIGFGDGTDADYVNSTVASLYDAEFTSSGAYSKRLSLTALVEAGMTYEVSAYASSALFGDGVLGSGSVNGVFSVDSNGIGLTFDDPGFLVAPVPLPAGGLLLIGALGSFALLARRRIGYCH